MKKITSYVSVIYLIFLCFLTSCTSGSTYQDDPHKKTNLLSTEASLIFTAEVEEPTEPIVDDTDGSNTDYAREEPVKEKTPFKYLYKYVTDEEIESMETLIKELPLMGQFPDYPTGCESVAAVNLLNFYGVDISVDEFIDEKLEKNISFYFTNGRMYGPSPYEFFLGDPRSERSWGCMSPVIAKAISKCTDMNVITSTDRSLEVLCDEYISKGDPVIVWVSIHMLDVSYTSSWYVDEETIFYWPNNEHCMLLVGYDDWYYYFNDPYVPAIVRYKKELAEDRFTKLGMQSIALRAADHN